jgi:hypothetical protein
MCKTFNEFCFYCCGFNDYNDENNENYNQIMKNNKEEEFQVLFLYNQSDEKIDMNIHQIVFYEEYLKGYYDEFNPNDKKILLIYNHNIKDIIHLSQIINSIHMNNGLLIKKDKKWIPKQIWVFN